MAAKTGMAGITVVGIGPGSLLDMTPRARAAIERAEVVAGYTTYIRLIEPLLADKEVIGTGMMQEIDRCRTALELAEAGRRVALVCGGGMVALLASGGLGRATWRSHRGALAGHVLLWLALDRAFINKLWVEMVLAGAAQANEKFERAKVERQ